jgi:hypothetical protein
MDIAILTTLISPFLPLLLNLDNKAAEKAIETVTEKRSEASWKKAQAVWQILSPKVAAKESIEEAMIDVANYPEDEDLQAVLRVQLKKLFEQDETLWKTIAQILKDISAEPTLCERQQPKSRVDLWYY